MWMVVNILRLIQTVRRWRAMESRPSGECQLWRLRALQFPFRTSPSPPPTTPTPSPPSTATLPTNWRSACWFYEKIERVKKWEFRFELVTGTAGLRSPLPTHSSQPQVHQTIYDFDFLCQFKGRVLQVLSQFMTGTGFEMATNLPGKWKSEIN